MQSAWRVIDCTNLDGQLKYARGRLVVRKFDSGEENQVTDLPLADIAILLIGLRCNCSAGLLHQCAENGVCVMVCDWRGVPIAAMHSWATTHTRITSRQRAQVAMTIPRQKNAWERIVKNKIFGQAACLDLLGIEGGNSLRGLGESVRSGDLGNVEGRAAREYWKRMFPGENGFKRLPGSGEGRNAQLDYGYMVLRGFATKAVISAGLNPSLGVNHHSGANYFCLVDDLIEVFRPTVDVKVARLSPAQQVADRDVKHYLVESVNRQFNGSGFTIPSVLNDFAQQYGMYAEGKIDKLQVPQFEEE